MEPQIVKNIKTWCLKNEFYDVLTFDEKVFVEKTNSLQLLILDKDNHLVLNGMLQHSLGWVEIFLSFQHFIALACLLALPMKEEGSKGI